MVGFRELDSSIAQRAVEALRVRRPGGGRRSATAADPGLLAALELLLEPATRGDPESPLRWTCKSTRRLAEELTRQDHRVGPRTVANLAPSRQATACKPIARPARGSAIPIETPSSSTSTPASPASLLRGQAGDLGRHQEEGTGRRLQERRTRVVSREANPKRSALTTSPTRRWARRSLTASTT